MPIPNEDSLLHICSILSREINNERWAGDTTIGYSNIVQPDVFARAASTYTATMFGEFVQTHHYPFMTMKTVSPKRLGNLHSRWWYPLIQYICRLDCQSNRRPWHSSVVTLRRSIPNIELNMMLVSCFFGENDQILRFGSLARWDGNNQRPFPT